MDGRPVVGRHIFLAGLDSRDGIGAEGLEITDVQLEGRGTLLGAINIESVAPWSHTEHTFRLVARNPQYVDARNEAVGVDGLYRKKQGDGRSQRAQDETLAMIAQYGRHVPQDSQPYPQDTRARIEAQLGHAVDPEVEGHSVGGRGEDTKQQSTLNGAHHLKPTAGQG